MKRQNVIVVALAAILLTPVAAAYGPTGNSTPTAGEPTADAPVSDSADGNYTRLYIEDGYRYSEVKPGDSATYNITVGNGEDSTVELNPHVVLPQVQGRPIEKAWVDIESAETTLAPDEERTFTVTVSVPEDTDLGDYRALIAFTNQTISYQGVPERPVHAATIGVEVYEEPTVEIRGESYYWSQIRAGDTDSYEIVVENTGDEAVPLNPTLNTNERRYSGGTNAVDRSWFDIDAPNEVEPGETATVTVTMSPPADADIGDYDATIDLGLTDPARPDRGDYWQQVDLRMEVWSQPSEPYETGFAVSEGTEDVTLTLSAPSMGESASENPVSFDVAFVAPNGTVVDHERVTRTTSGHVTLGESRRGDSQGPYTAGREDLEFTYRVDDPVDGQWTLRVLPQNTMDFSYDIVRNESAD